MENKPCGLRQLLTYQTTYCVNKIMCEKMMRFVQCVFIAMLYGAQLIQRLHGATNTTRTTTAVPFYNVSGSSAPGHTPNDATTIKTMPLPTTEPIFHTKTSVPTRETITLSPTTVPALTGSHQQTDRRNFDTTTAAPPFAGHAFDYHRFDALSFMGGCLLTICLVIIGTMAWKMYIAHVERRYWTL